MTSTIPGTAVPRTGRIGQKPAFGMALVLITQLMLVLDATVVNVALPGIGADLHFGAASLAWVLNAYTLAFGGLLLLGGRLGDVLGRLKIFYIGVAVFVSFSLLGGLAQTSWELVTARGLQGVGAVLAAPSVLALLTTNAPNDAARNRALAAFAAVSSSGGALGLILGGTLTNALSWRWTLFINVPIGIVILAFVWRHVNETPRRHGRFDFVGAITATAGAAAIVWSLIETPTNGWGSVRTIGGLALGALLIAAFAVTELRHPHPLLRMGLLSDRRRVAGLVTMAANYGGMLALFFLMVQYLEGQLGYGPMQTGFAFLPMPLSIFAMSRIMPRLVARYGQAPFVVAGAVGLTLAFTWLTQVEVSDGYLGVFPALLVTGISMGGSFMPITSLVLSGVEPEHAGSASGLLQTMQQLGGSVGLAVVASVFAGHETSSFISGAHAGYGAGVALAVLALLSASSLMVRRPALLGG